MSGIIVDIILFFILAGNAILGYKRGLVRVIFSICSSLIAIILVLLLYKPTTNYIINHTSAAQKIESAVEEKIESLFQQDNEKQTTDLSKDDNRNSILKIFIEDETQSFLNDTTERVEQYVSVQIAHKVISVVVFFALFVLVRLLLYIVKSYIDLIANLPILKQINHSGGLIYGVIKGFFIIYITFAILSLMMPMMNHTIFTTAIQSAPIGSKMFNHNMILNLIFKFL